jgi:hypothetical protein
MNLSNLPGNVLASARDYLVTNNKAKDYEQADYVISTLSDFDLLDAYLRWNGIIGFTRDIKAAVEGIKQASTDIGEVDVDAIVNTASGLVDGFNKKDESCTEEGMRQVLESSLGEEDLLNVAAYAIAITEIQMRK